METPETTGEAGPLPISEEGARLVDQIVGRYPQRLAAMLPVLWVVQVENGWISPAAMEWVAGRLGCSAATVQAVVTFYTMFDDRPVGRHKIQVCRTLSCELMGARRIIDHLREKLGIEPGETTPDGLFTLQEVECLASCGTAPMMQVNFKYYENLTPERIEALIDELRNSEPDWKDVEPVVHERPTAAEFAAMAPRAPAPARGAAGVGGRS